MCPEVFSEAIGGRVLFSPDLSSGVIPPLAGRVRCLLAGEKAEGAKGPHDNQKKPTRAQCKSFSTIVASHGPFFG